MGIQDLGYLNGQPGRAVPKGKTRLQETVAERKLTTVTEKDFKAAVWARDKNRCRVCGRKVLKAMGRVPERGDVHHLHGRTGDLRFEAKAAILVCLSCHEDLTGRAGGVKVIAMPTRTFVIRQGTFADATHLIRFKRV